MHISINKMKYLIIVRELTRCEVRSCHSPILTYAAETRADALIAKRALRTYKIKIPRSICEKTLLDNARNVEIREVCYIENIVKWSKKRRRIWNEHINRTTNDRLAKIVRNDTPSRRRSFHRLPKR